MEALLQLDGNILLYIQEYIRQPWLTPIMKLITMLGDKGAIWILIGIILLLMKKHRKEGYGVAIALAIGVLITNICLKNLVARPRPYTMIEGLNLLVGPADDWSFPSGHTCSSFAAAFAMLGLSEKKIAIPAVILAVLIGFSRLYVGIHYPTDVIVGAVIGLISAYIAVKITKKYGDKFPGITS